MVRILLFLFCLPIICFGQTEQAFYGRTLDSAAILNSDITDSSINLNKLIYVNGPKLIGNPAATYDSLKCIKLGTNLSFSNDTLNAASSGGTGDVNQNGNSFGATMVLGTNDNNTLELETNGVSRLGITSGATTGGNLTCTAVTTNTNTVNNSFTLRTNSTGTAAAGFGGGILFQGETTTTNNMDMAVIKPLWTTATHGSRIADIVFYNAQATALQEIARIRGQNSDIVIGTALQASYGANTLTTAQAYTVGNSANALTLGGSSGTVTVSTSNTGAGALTLSSSSTNGTIIIGNTSSNGATAFQTSASAKASTTVVYKGILFNNSYAPTSNSTGLWASFQNEAVINQTGGAVQISRGYYDNPSLTSVGDYRAIETNANTANAWHLYQSGSSSKGNTLLKTSIGTTTAPTSLLMLAAGTASANTAPLKFTSGTNLTTPEAGAVEYDASNLYITNGSTIRFTIAKMLSGSATLDFGNTAAGTSDDLTVTITGAADGDEVVLGVPNAAMNASSSYFAWVSATNTITIRHNNYSTGAINPASATFKVSVIKR